MASAVTAEQTVSRAERHVEQAIEQKQPLQGRPRFIYAFTYINLFLQVLALALALYSLGVHELSARLLAACLVLAGLLLVFLPTWTTTWRVYAEYNELVKNKTEVKLGKFGNWL